MLAAMESPNSFTAAVCASKWCTGALPARSCDGMPQRRAGDLEVGLAREVGRRHLVVGEHHRGVVGLDGLQHLVGGRHHEIAAEHQVGARHAGADRMDLLGGLGDAHVAGDRAALLGEARHVDGAEALALQVRGLAEHGRQRHHAGAADARHQHGVGLVERRQLRLGQARQHAGDAASRRPACWPSSPWRRAPSRSSGRSR